MAQETSYFSKLTDEVYEIRKHGHVSVDTKAEMEALMEAADKVGHVFLARRTIFGWDVVDAEM